jgi:anthranilate synthase component 1
MVIFDHVNKTVLAVANAEIGSQKSEVTEDELRRTYNAALERVDRLVERLQRGAVGLQLTDIDADRRSPVGLDYRSNFAREAFEAAVVKAKEYIHAGDVFQVVISQRLQTETRARPFDIYRALRVINPSPFMFYLDAGPVRLIGASPEIELPSGRWLAPGPVVRRRTKTPGWRRNSRPTPRNEPSTSCSSTWAATMSAGWPGMARFNFPTCSASNGIATSCTCART